MKIFLKIFFLIAILISILYYSNSQIINDVKLPDSIEAKIEKLPVIDKIKTLQNISWDNRFEDPTLAINCASKSILIAEENNFKELAIQGLSYIGVIHLQQSNYEDAQKIFIRALELSNQNNFEEQKGWSYNNLGHLRYLLGDYEQAKEYLFKSLKIMNMLDNKQGSGYAYLRLSEVYTETNQLDSALYFANQAIEIRKKIGNEKLIARAQLNLGKILEEKKQYKKALDLYLSIKNKIQEKGKIEIAIARCYFNLNNISECIKYAKIGYDLSLPKKNYVQLVELSDLLFKSYKKLNDLNNALLYLEKKYEFSDQLINDNKNKQIAFLHYTYNFKQKEAENQLLLTQAKLKDRLLLFAWIGIGILGLAVIIIVISWKKVKHYNHILKEQNEQIQNQTKLLRELNITKDKFFSIIAHDLKNPIGSYKNIVGFMSENFEDLTKEEIKEFIETMYVSAENLQELLEQLLEWSKLQSNKIETHLTTFDVTKIIESNINLLQSMAQQKNINLELINKENIYVEADMNMINTVIRNLLSNAIKFTNFNGRIIVDYKINNDKVIVMVKDDGVGMNEKTLNSLFDLAEKKSLPGTNNEKGTGLGLILCKEFVERNNGKIWVESKLGEGSTFYFSLNLSK
jgi:signal transduction histidine kinase